MTSSICGVTALRSPAPSMRVLRVEVSTAIGRCTGCGRTGPMAEVRVFDPRRGRAARPVTRSCCGCVVPAGPGWTCAA